MIAGIVTFNPDIERLKQNVDSIYIQVSVLVIVDNGSENINEIEKLCHDYKNIVVISLNENKGIACAQNEICKYAEDHGYEWAITLDQDSISPDNLVEEYNKYVDKPNVGMLCPRIIDVNVGDIDVFDDKCPTIAVNDCLASASAINIKAWREVGGFYEPMFIDKVDFDICFSLREHGYFIYRINTLKLLHEVGHSVTRKLLLKTVRVFNHSHIRIYYMIRNSFIMMRRHGYEFRWLKGIISQFLTVSLFEQDKKRKLNYWTKGLLDGIRKKEGKLQV